MAIDIDTEIHPCPFEGPEKLLEIWFAPTAQYVYDAFVASRPQGVDVEDVEEGKYGLRAVERRVWDEMLDIVKCKVLSVLYGTEMDAYLLRYARDSIAIISKFNNDCAVNRRFSFRLIASS